MSDETQPGDGPADPQVPPPTKSKPRTSREFERALREMGFSKSEARRIACHGFRGLDLKSDPDVEDAYDKLVALLQRTLIALDATERQ